MPFQLDVATEAKLTEVGVLSDKDREPDANPGAGLAFTMTLPNTAATMFDGFLRGMLFQKPPPAAGEQGEMVGDGLTEPTKIAKALGQFNWDEEFTGYTLTFDYGLGAKSNFNLEDVKLSDWKIQAKPGSIVLKFKAEAPDVSEKIHGKLALLKSQPVKILLEPPVIDDSAGSDE